MKSILLWARRLLLAALGLVCIVSLGGAVLSGHTFGAIAWALVLLGVLALSAVLFGERFVAAPVAVVSEVTGLLRNLPARFQWLVDAFTDKKAGVIPGPQADALVTALVAEMLKDAAPPTEALSLIHISEPTRRSYISYAVFCLKKIFLMLRRLPRSTPLYSSAASDVYKRQHR